jgi:hypothetical protein
MIHTISFGCIPFAPIRGILTGPSWPQQETEQLTRILISAALSRAVSSIAELGVADLIQTGQPQSVEYPTRAM